MLKFNGPVKERFARGVSVIHVQEDGKIDLCMPGFSLLTCAAGNVMIGGGDGTVAVCKPDTLKFLQSTKVSPTPLCYATVAHSNVVRARSNVHCYPRQAHLCRDRPQRNLVR